MRSYRARLTNGRVVGPFELSGIAELAQKGHIKGTEEFQEFPTGDWAPLSMFPELREVVENASFSENDNSEATFVRKLLDIGEKTTSPPPEESQFPKEFNYQVPLENESLPKTETVEASVGGEEKNGDFGETLKTELLTKHSFKQEENEEKTVITKDTMKYLEKKKSEEERRREEEKAAKEGASEQYSPPEPNLEADTTQLISLNDVKKEILDESNRTEKLLEAETIKSKHPTPSKPPSVREAQPEDESGTKENFKRKKLFIIAAAVALVFLMLPEDKKSNSEQVKLVYPNISFPQQYETPDQDKANNLYRKAVEEYAKGKYPSKVKAAEYFKASLENKFKNNPAAAKLIFTYSELLEHAATPTQDATRIFKLIQIFRSEAFKDPNLAAAIALFYKNVGKAAASVKTVEKFNAIKGNKPTMELFAIFLESLVENGELVKAKAVEEKLSSVPEKNLFVQESLFNYYFFKGEFEKSGKILVEMERKNPNLVSVLLKKAALFLYKEDFASLEVLLKKVRSFGVEGSRLYYAKYLEYRGLLAVKNGKQTLAVKAFKKALSLKESLELRSRLAALDASGEAEADVLINESKAIKLIARSKGHWKKDNIKFAFKDALEASRIAPNYLPAQLYVAELQIRQSFFNEAIKSLEDLYDKNPHNPKVVFGLIDAYIEAYKFEKVRKMLNILAGSELRLHPEYFSKMAKYYVYKDEFAGAVAWLQKAINANPLDDETTYELAKMFMRYRKYNQAKVLLNKCMDLDPSKVDFRVSYGNILYETEGANPAIGYLYDVLRDFPDNAKILSAIGIYYYRSGQIKMFQSTKEKLLKLPDKDPALFEFLIKAAKLDEKYDDVVRYAQELIKLNPGDLSTRLFLGQLYMEMSKYKEALAQFNAIKDRLKTYPKLQYYMSKLYLLTDDIEKATLLAKAEIDGNPGAIDGYVLLGDILKKQGKYNEAENQYKAAQKINPRNVDVLVGLAYINFMKSQYEIALDLFKKAKAYEPGRAEIHKLLGDVYRKIGQSRLAVESYKMFLELSPNTRYKQNLQNYIRMMQ